MSYKFANKTFRSDMYIKLEYSGAGRAVPSEC